MNVYSTKIGELTVEELAEGLMVGDLLDVSFHDESIEPQAGNVVFINRAKTLTLTIYGTSMSRTVRFYSVDSQLNVIPIIGVNLSDYTLGTSTNGTTQLWQFDVTGLIAVYMELVAVDGGNVSVKGRLVT